MNDLWRLLRCPACGGELSFQSYGGADGLLRCGCGLWYPVVDEIPRIFIGELRKLYQTQFGDFVRRHALDGIAEPTTLSSDTRAKLATQESFGFEWTHFNEMLPEWEKNARFYFEPLGLESLKNVTLLDAGCGKGRHAYYALRSGSRVIAVDLSRAVDVAKRNCMDVAGERLFVQADLMALPFAPATFDLVCSFGVLHHLPDPEGGFRRIAQLARSHGHILVYLYHAHEGAPLKRAILRAVDVARRVTVKLPHSLLLPLTNVIGYGLFATVVWPYKALSKLPATRTLAEAMPLKMYANYPIRVIINDQFDRFSAPIENRYTAAEVRGWVDRAGLKTNAILGGAGWRALAQRP